MKKILHMVGVMDLGGQETFIMNVYDKIDKNKYQFDFIVQTEKKGYYDDKIRKMGGKIFIITRFSKNPIKHVFQLYKILKNDSYYAFHRHTNSSIVFVDLIVAKICKIRNIIVHSHSTSSNTSNLIHYLFRPFIVLFSDKRVACSNNAGKFMFGGKNYYVLNNGIDIKKFVFNVDIRNKIRRKYNISKNDILIGHVGRFTNEKNHDFIIKFFEQIKKNKNTNYFLFLIGSGPEKSNIEKLVNSLKLENSVLFIGNVNNVYEYLQAFDLFVFPSKFEGLGISLIEAQSAGLYCFASDAVPDEAILTDHVCRLPISSVDLWVNQFNIINNVLKKRIIYNESDNIFLYDISQTVNNLLAIYEER